MGSNKKIVISNNDKSMIKELTDDYKKYRKSIKGNKFSGFLDSIKEALRIILNETLNDKMEINFKKLSELIEIRFNVKIPTKELLKSLKSQLELWTVFKLP